MKNIDLLNLFKNSGFKIVTDPVLGKTIEMTPEQAYAFSSIVGASYLIYPYGITMKGRSEVFIHRSVFSNNYYIYSPGLFGRDINGKLIEGESAEVLLSKFPSVFSGKKHVLICDIALNEPSNIEPEIYKKIKQNNLSPENYLIYKNLESGSSAEPLFEYFASLYFIKNGYITENQAPWFQQNLKYKNLILQGGIPDFSAFHSKISNYLNAMGIIDDKNGIALSLLPVIANFRKINKYNGNAKNLYNYELKIGEAKSSRSSLPTAIKQLQKYQSVDLADELFSIIPDVSDNDVNSFGEFYLQNDTTQYNKPSKTNRLNNIARSTDSEWIDNYIKLLLLGNVKFPKIIEYIDTYRIHAGLKKLEEYEAIHLLDAIIQTDLKTFFLTFFN
ncbi:MAG: hypothetical protein PHR39_08640 [Actinomycetota bacterium]|nr:hypothetical protein [Actinomycetota bacterium]